MRSLVQDRDRTATASAVSLAGVDVAFRLAGASTFTAVRDTSLAVADGEFVAIVGPTGCGKSTLLNIAAGLIAPAAGTVDIFGVGLGGLNRQAGYLFQADALFPWKTALENVAIGLETAGTPAREARQRAGDWLSSVGLGAFGDRYPHMLSGGQRKRVGLAQVLIRDPKILLMDEAFALSDRVVIMSAGPAARIIGDWRVALARPRDISEVKLDPAFHALHRDIWHVLKAEVIKGYTQAEGA